MSCTSSLCSVLVAAAAACSSARGASRPVLRVCSDPHNLPFSNERGEGFENALAQLVADDLGRTVDYTFLPQRRGFIRNTLKAHKCDVVMGAPVGYGMAATTQPYYRSSYAFVTRADRHLDLRTFDDPRLRDLRIGVHAIGGDATHVPPADALARRGLVDRTVSFPIYGDYRHASPPSELIDAVARGDIDVAIAWGPLAGYFAQHEAVPLAVTPIASDEPGMTFAIGLATRRTDVLLHALLDVELVRARPRIDALLARFGVPRTPEEER